LEDRRRVGASSYNSGDGTDQRVHPVLDVYDDDDNDDNDYAKDGFMHTPASEIQA
jgi:hypothetical protein